MLSLTALLVGIVSSVALTTDIPFLALVGVASLRCNVIREPARLCRPLCGRVRHVHTYGLWVATSGGAAYPAFWVLAGAVVGARRRKPDDFCPDSQSNSV
jgi:hypothetical protein